MKWVTLSLLALLVAVAVAQEKKCCECPECPSEKPEEPVDWSCQWKIFHFEEYSHGATGWTNNEVSECDCQKLLGGYRKFSGGEVSKNWEGLPKHTMLRVKGNYYFIDEWDKETAYVKVDDKMGWTYPSHDNTYKGINACGDPLFADYINEMFDFVMRHEEPCVKITVGSNLDEGPDNESWGLANLALYTCEYTGLSGTGQCEVMEDQVKEAPKDISGLAPEEPAPAPAAAGAAGAEGAEAAGAEGAEGAEAAPAPAA